jgi:hypothetical protein
VISADAFKPVGINIHQFVGFEQGFNLRLDAGEAGVKIVFAQIAEPEMHHPRRRRTHHDPVGKVRVFADDDQLLLAGKFPDL